MVRACATRSMATSESVRTQKASVLKRKREAPALWRGNERPMRPNRPQRHRQVRLDGSAAKPSREKPSPSQFCCAELLLVMAGPK